MNSGRGEIKGRKGINRRTFVAGGSAAGALAAAGFRLPLPRARDARPDLAVALGPSTAKNVREAVEALGGMGAFVAEGQVVGILVNVLGAIPAAHTKPDVIRTVVAMCREAGAKEVRIVDWRDLRIWQRNRLIEVVEELKVNFVHVDINNPDLWRSVDVPRGKAVQKVRIFEALFEPDVFISLPLMKHHGSTRFTGALKLYLGSTHPMDNRTIFHRERGVYLEQCIADLNTVVRPADLVVMEAMEVLTTRGPVGPGESIKPQKIVAGFDRVAIDTYTAPVLGVDPAGATQIKAAYAHGVGEIDLGKLKIMEIEIA